MRLSAHGDLGVNLFFAISGFLICGLLLKEYQTDGDINLRRFYLRRCFRILPPVLCGSGRDFAFSPSWGQST